MSSINLITDNESFEYAVLQKNIKQLRDRVSYLTEQRDSLLTSLDQKDDDIKRLLGLLQECLSFALKARIGETADLWQRVSSELDRALEKRLSL